MEKVAKYVRVGVHKNSNAVMSKRNRTVCDFCEQKEYEICDSACVVGGHEIAYPIFIELLKSAKEKGISRVIMFSFDKITETEEELNNIKNLIEEAGIVIETLDGSYNN